MSGETKTAGKLLKYVDSDFSSGLAYFTSGINNVLCVLINGLESEVLVQSPINGFFLSELIEQACEGVEFKVCDSKYIVFSIADKCISVICNGTQLRFQLVNGKPN